ncbi:gamma-glutamylcyclotransferase [Algirhabdus cladophorae]|uniref:gamma-glutamylcyclotransferase n=1 Tax=Algirhabdus cladophorae TaxID=3377108 RepID=UPI003B847E2E
MALWVFGYGSLLWNPGFDVAEEQMAVLEGYHRSFSMWSIHHRGTPTDRGLVLALDASAGASCQGVALRAKPGTEEATLAELRARELISSAYFEQILPVRLHDGRQIEAVSYVIDPQHDQYTGPQSLETQAQIIARAKGDRGPNSEYLHNTQAHLVKIGIHDPDLEWLDARVRQIAG